MTYTITIYNKKVVAEYSNKDYNAIISPTLITKPDYPYKEYDIDMLNKAGFVLIPLYKRQEYCAIPLSSSLTINSDSTDEVLYYREVSVDGATITITPDPISEKGSTDYGLLFNSILDRSISDFSFLSDPEFTEIGDYCFSGCSNIGEITIPGNIKSIQYCSFSNCSITSLVIEDGLETLGNGSFSNCENLIYVKMPTTLKTIDIGAFSSCLELEEIEFPEGITTIPASVVGGCSKLKHIIIPSTVTTITSGAFGGVGYALPQDQNVVITINKPEGSISGSPWGTAHATTVEWVG